MNYHDGTIVSTSTQEFQGLILEREEERKMKSEEKRQQDLRRIVDMKSKDGTNPLTVFPKEIWLPILDQITPEDRGNAWKVHPMFQDLMESNRIRDILLPQALKFVLDHVKNNDHIIFRATRDILESDISEFVKLRQVSKSLMLSFDQWIEEKFEEQLHQRSFKPKIWNPVPVMAINLDRDMDRLNRLVANYSDDQRPAKIFPFRSIEVVVTAFDPDIRDGLREQSYLPFTSAISKLVELIGEQLLSFRLRVNPVNYLTQVGISLADHYVMLRECCQVMPNLKRLDISFELEHASYYPKTVKNVPLDLIRAIENTSFPNLSKLERVSFEQDQCYHVTQDIYDAILKANPHVKMLRFFIEDSLLKKVSKDAMKALNLEYFSWDNTAFSHSPRSSYNPLCRSWPLKTLNIQTKSETLGHVIKSLNAFPTLEKVTIYMAKMEILRDNKFLKLPNLSHLDLQCTVKIDYDRDDVNFFFSLQFLLYAKKLKMLRWNCCRSYRFGWDEPSNVDQTLLEYLEKNEFPKKMIDFRGGVRDINTSNVWNVFPELEMVEIGGGDDKTFKLHHRPEKVFS